MVLGNLLRETEGTCTILHMMTVKPIVDLNYEKNKTEFIWNSEQLRFSAYVILYLLTFRRLNKSVISWIPSVRKVLSIV